MTASKRTKNDVKADLRRLADLVKREVDAGADSVEEIHRSIAAMPLDVLEKLDVLESTVKEVRKAQQVTIGAIYKLIHKVNHEVGKLAQDLLDGRAAQSRKAARPAARKAAATRRPAPAQQVHSHA
jgi:hypothetical protein